MKLLVVLLSLFSLSLAATLHGVDVEGRIPDSYIVIYNLNVTSQQAANHWAAMENVVSIKFKYDSGDLFRGFAAEMNEATVQKLLSDPMVKEIHCDAMAYAAKTAEVAQPQCTTEPTGSWGVARVYYEGTIPPNGIEEESTHNLKGGDGCRVFVLDTGCKGHNDFTGRMVQAANFVDGVADDQNGHGTHCACTVGGHLYGVAKGVSIHCVKVLGASGGGSYSGILAGIDYVANAHNGAQCTIISMSLGGPQDGGMGAAIKAAHAKGVIVVVAAGNSQTTACSSYPAAIPECITVFSTDVCGTESNQYDCMSSFSNYGPCCDVGAPGSLIISCGISSPTSARTLSGTSMACPHVAGIVALIKSHNPTMTPAAVEAELKRTCQNQIVRNLPANTPNLLVYTGCK